MASLSLPRVLQTRKTSLDIEREQFEKAQNIAIHKAINKEECPVKQKHVRSAIIGTFSQQGAHIFWGIALRLPCMDDMIVAWKFCHVLHKVLREGHPLCIDHSQKHIKFLEDIGKLWVVFVVDLKGHLEEGYGKLIRQYATVLIAKLDFHRRNPRFPGNLNVTTEDLTSICANNLDVCFQMSVEMFDYLDTILDLQETIFRSKASSMTMQGQCRLAPIIPCIQDASRIYDHNVKILFLLHSTVPYDVLEGHRTRFLKQFKQLKKFYQHTNSMHYFKNLITVAPLPESPPNFKASVNTYVTQEVYVPHEEEEPPSEANLIDTSDNFIDNLPTPPPPQPQPVPQPPPLDLDILAERDNIIKSLHEDCNRLRREIHQLCQKNTSERNLLQDSITTLETKLAIKESELTQEKLINEASAMQAQDDELHKQKEEKFKASYLKLREEHINLLREKAKVEKTAKMLEQKVGDIEQGKKHIEDEYREAKTIYEQTQEQIKLTDDERKEELNKLRKWNESFCAEIETLKKSLQEVRDEREAVERELNESLSHKGNLESRMQDMLTKISDKENELGNMKVMNDTFVEEIIKKSLEENESIMQYAIEEIDNPAMDLVTCSPDYFRNLTGGCQESLKSAMEISRSEPIKTIMVANRLAHKHAIYILQGRATSNTSPDISFGEKMTETCKVLGESILELLTCLKENKDAKEAAEKSLNQISNVVSLAETISGSVKGEAAETLVSMLESEMMAMDKAIEEAAKKITEMLSNSREADSGIKLQVNERILDSCTILMQAIRVLVQKSKLLQEEIIKEGKGTASAKEFYKRNHRWTDGFISAAKAVGAAAQFLLDAADKVVSGKGKLEQLVVAAQEISASTAQLVVASRVKANRNSVNLQQLSHASKDVTNATGVIVGTVKDCSELMEEATEVDTTNMSLHQAKRLEMDTQVRVLELEKELQQERQRLSSLRKYHYQLAGEAEGWDTAENNN